ncbi:hypothetical protein J2Z44_004030 [Clostridium punense]|uniref:Lipoprotein n=2 Tax=Clostridium TaxID=1485 RepID=A0ABS4K8S5_9CLOT|nr:hypothetical protein [Clostridium punense]MBP2024175.1 hypothetical protein [Clostridium punense]
MKKHILFCIIAGIMTISLVGCQKENKLNKEVLNEASNSNSSIIINNTSYEDEPDNSVIKKRYDNVNKEQLTYEIVPQSGYFYESENEIVSSFRLNEIPSINNKKYWHILQDYTYACELNPTKLSYDEAIKLISKVLPSDIKKEREKLKDGDEYLIRSIIYSSSKGNFIVQLVHPKIEDENLKKTTNLDSVIGISYLKEE